MNKTEFLTLEDLGVNGEGREETTDTLSAEITDCRRMEKRKTSGLSWTLSSG